MFCLSVLAVVLLLPFDVSGKKSKDEVDIFELTIDENINSPELGKVAKAIITFQNEQVAALEKLQKEGFPYNLKTIRDGEVIMITIQARHLFKPNESELCENGKRILTPLIKYINTPKLYKMVLAMHSDNTGNDIYTMDITTRRVNSIFDWLGETNKAETDYVVPYALGSSDPITDNNSVANRDSNRRLVIYLVPGEAMVTQAKRNKIVL